MAKQKTNREMSEATDTQHAIGKVVTNPNAAARDAIHIAVLLATADTDLWTGQNVKLKFGTKDVAIKCVKHDDMGIGIVDPFGPEIEKGQKFYIFLHPNTITGLHHQWSHATIDAPMVSLSDAETWLRQFADRWGMRYGDMIEAALTATPGVAGVEPEDKPYLTAHGRDLHGKEELEPGEFDAFWNNMEVVTGRTFSPAHREGISWSCSC